MPVCPEVLGGLSTPRPPSEILQTETGLRVVNVLGQDVTGEYMLGASIALDIGLQAGCRKAILKARSPACGFGSVYDGTFRRNLVQGHGIFAKLLERHGFRIYTDETFPTPSRKEHR